MKQKFYIILTGLFLLSVQVNAQAPNAFNYQGVARDASGNILSDQPIGLEFTIHQTAPGGTIVYQETHLDTTNQFGIFSVAIGEGTVVSGSFASISWGTNSEYLEVGMDPTGGTNYTDMGTTQFLSVPYALYAASSGSAGVNSVTGIPPIYVTNPDSTPVISIQGTAPDQGGVLYSNGAGISAVFTPTGTAGQVLASNGTAAPTWVTLSASGVAGWNLTGNSGTIAGANFVGTTDANDLVFKANGGEAMRISSSTGSVGIGTINPTQKLDVVGNIKFSGALMPDNLAGAAGNILLSEGASVAPTWLANGTDGQVLTLSGGVPTWATATGSGLMTATAPLSISGSDVSLIGTLGGVIYGTGTGSAFTAAGPTGDVLEGQGAGNPPVWSSLAAALTTSSIVANVGSSVVITNGANQCVGASNVSVDVQGTAGGIFYGTGSGTSAMFTSFGTAGQVLSSNGTGAPTWITLSGSGTGDNWGAQVAITDSNETGAIENTITGDGVPSSPLKLAQQGATTGQVLEWNGTSWKPATSSIVSNAWNLTGNSGTTAGTNFVGTTDANDVVFKANGGEAMRISNGTLNVGIGIANPAQKLDVAGNIKFSGALMPDGEAGAAGNLLLSGGAAPTAPTWLANGTDGQVLTMNAGVPTWAVPSAVAGVNNITATPPLYITGSASAPDINIQGLPSGTDEGGVLYSTGAGTSAIFTPTGAAGQVLQSNGTGAPTWVTLPGSGSGWSLTGNSGTTAGTNFIGTTDATDFVIKTNGNEQVRITSGGNVGIATSTPAQALEVGGITNTIRVDGLKSAGPYNASATSTSNLLYVNNATGDFYALPDGASGTVLTLSGGVPTWATGVGDNWGTQVAITDSTETSAIENTITGDGLPSSPLKLAQQGATTGQTLEWNGTTWIPQNLQAKTLFTATNGATIDVIVGINIINSSGSLTSLTISLPSSPTDGQCVELIIPYGIGTITYSGGTVINSAAFNKGAGSDIRLVYDAGTSSWY